MSETYEFSAMDALGMRCNGSADKMGISANDGTEKGVFTGQLLYAKLNLPIDISI